MSTSRWMADASASMAHVFAYLTQSKWAQRQGEPELCDFVVGNPHEMPLTRYSAALGRWSAPQDKDWYAYKMSEPRSREVVAATLREQRGLQFEEEDIQMTNGAFAALAVCLRAVVNPDDEVIFISPPWFFYEGLILSIGAQPVRVRCDPVSYDLDVGAIANAVTNRTRAIIINSPNNPTGKIYPPETLKQLADVLTDASARNGQPVYLLSDESYWRIRYDGRPYSSPTGYYPQSFLIYTYGKTLLTPGQRIGYIALPPTMPNRDEMRMGLMVSQLMTGYAFPNALLQHALPDLEVLSIDVGHLQRKRDRMVNALTEIGYTLHRPEGTFYLLPQAPIADDGAFMEMSGRAQCVLSARIRGGDAWIFSHLTHGQR